MKTSKTWIYALPAVLLFGFCNSQSSHADIVYGQVDAFITPGSADGWSEGAASPNPPAYDAGPGNDGLAGHLANVSTNPNPNGGGSGTRLLMFNTEPRWLGDYLSAAVTTISLYADNRSGNGTDINLRLAFNGAGGWFYTDAVTIADASGWTNIRYDLASLNYASGGSGMLNDTMSGVTRFEIFSAESAIVVAGSNIQGDRINADLRVDNISAIPEPATASLIFCSMAFVLSRRRR